MAIVLDVRRRGRLASRRSSTAPTPGRAGRAVHLPRGQGARRSASWPSARASTSRASWAYSDSESDLPMLRAVGHPVAVNPDAELARVAREEGWEVLRFERLGRRLRVRRGGARRGGGRRLGGAGAVGGRGAMSLHELDRRAAGDPRARAALRRRADRAARRRAGTASTASRASCLAELGELGLMGVCVPEEHGGAGADFLSYVLVLEELSRADAGVGVTVAVHTSAGTLPILAHGSPSRSPALALAQGEELGAFALTEAGLGLGRGRDAHALTRDGRITGTKQWITNGSHASTFIVFARDGERHQRVRRARAAPTASRSTREEEKLGLNSSSTADLALRGHAGRAARRAAAGHARSRCARSTAGASGSPPRRSGSPRRRSTSPRGYAKERNAFGGPIGGFGAIQQKLADMQTEIEAARALTWRAARLKEAGRPHTVEGAQAKLFACARRAPPDRRGDPGPRRLRLHEGVPGRALLPRRQGHRDLRGHERDPAARDRRARCSARPPAADGQPHQSMAVSARTFVTARTLSRSTHSSGAWRLPPSGAVAGGTGCRSRG